MSKYAITSDQVQHFLTAHQVAGQKYGRAALRDDRAEMRKQNQIRYDAAFRLYVFHHRNKDVDSREMWRKTLEAYSVLENKFFKEEFSKTKKEGK